MGNIDKSVNAPDSAEPDDAMPTGGQRLAELALIGFLVWIVAVIVATTSHPSDAVTEITGTFEPPRSDFERDLAAAAEWYLGHFFYTVLTVGGLYLAYPSIRRSFPRKFRLWLAGQFAPSTKDT